MCKMGALVVIPSWSWNGAELNHCVGALGTVPGTREAEHHVSVCCDFQEFGGAGDRGCFVLDSHTRAGFPGGTLVKSPPASAEDVGSIPGLGRSPGNGNSLQYSCVENSMD